jgi:hypothetical protein
MALFAIVDALRTHLLGAITPGLTTVGGLSPSSASDLPAVTISVNEVSREMSGIGRAPKLSSTGALPVTTRVDLADPVLRFFGEPGGVSLLDGTRRVLQAPHAPLVHADGTDTPPPLVAADFTARIVGGTVFTVVSTTPTGTQVQPDAEPGIVRFGSALAGGGTLELTYFIGQWETRSTRYQGVLAVEVMASTVAATDTLSRQVDQALRQEQVGHVPGLNRIAPASWGPVGPTPLLPSARARTFTYHFDYELQEPIIPTGGGVIARVEVDELYGGNNFVVTR